MLVQGRRTVMIRDLFIVALPIVLLVDCALLVTWLARITVDKMWIPSQFSLRSVLIAMTVIAVQLGILASVLSGHPDKGAASFDGSICRQRTSLR